MEFIDVKLDMKLGITKGARIPGSASVRVTKIRVSGEVCVFLEPQLDGVVVCFKNPPAVTWDADIVVNARNAILAKMGGGDKAGWVEKAAKFSQKAAKRFKTIGQTNRLDKMIAKAQDFSDVHVSAQTMTPSPILKRCLPAETGPEMHNRGGGRYAQGTYDPQRGQVPPRRPRAQEAAGMDPIRVRGSR